MKNFFKCKYVQLAFVLLVYCVVMQVLFHKICPVALVTGIPCPGCGITRALFLLVTGHPILAFSMNPCVYLWILCCLLLVCQCFDKNIRRFDWHKNNSRRDHILITTGVLSILVYIVKMYIYYPDTVPYVYYDSCLISRLKYVFFSLYSNIWQALFQALQ